MTPEQWQEIKSDFIACLHRTGDGDVGTGSGEIVRSLLDCLGEADRKGFLIESTLFNTTLPRTVFEDEPEYRKQIDRFEIIEVLGSGAFGTVYRAKDTPKERLLSKFRARARHGMKHCSTKRGQQRSWITLTSFQFSK